MMDRPTHPASRHPRRMQQHAAEQPTTVSRRRWKPAESTKSSQTQFKDQSFGRIPRRKCEILGRSRAKMFSHAVSNRVSTLCPSPSLVRGGLFFFPVARRKGLFCIKNPERKLNCRAFLKNRLSMLEGEPERKKIVVQPQLDFAELLQNFRYPENDKPLLQLSVLPCGLVSCLGLTQEAQASEQVLVRRELDLSAKELQSGISLGEDRCLPPPSSLLLLLLLLFLCCDKARQSGPTHSAVTTAGGVQRSPLSLHPGPTCPRRAPTHHNKGYRTVGREPTAPLPAGFHLSAVGSAHCYRDGDAGSPPPCWP
ncbi:hypothetical protein Taro_055738 [Colocasia esculenta]|uniref:Uncharacterized protein n=1 Tax=Colocasia esculenta TaxID=4460 RepID=A0A843XUA0_COLES|nr:hypothetical protein [Colocasia esculenta]